MVETPNGSTTASFQHGTQKPERGETFQSALEYMKKESSAASSSRSRDSQLRDDIGKNADAPVPDGVDYDLWLGPAPSRPFNPNRFPLQLALDWTTARGDPRK